MADDDRDRGFAGNLSLAPSLPSGPELGTYKEFDLCLSMVSDCKFEVIARDVFVSVFST